MGRIRIMKISFKIFFIFLSVLVSLLCSLLLCKFILTENILTGKVQDNILKIATIIEGVFIFIYFYFISDNNSIKQQKITDKISIPRIYGDNQYGNARFMFKNEINAYFKKANIHKNSANIPNGRFNCVS